MYFSLIVAWYFPPSVTLPCQSTWESCYSPQQILFKKDQSLQLKQLSLASCLLTGNSPTPWLKLWKGHQRPSLSSVHSDLGIQVRETGLALKAVEGTDGPMGLCLTHLCSWSQECLEMANLRIDHGVKWGKEKRKKVLLRQASKQQTYIIKKKLHLEIDLIFILLKLKSVSNMVSLSFC